MDEQARIARALALGLLGDATIGERVVVRARDGAGATDALGDLVARTPDSVTIDTRRGRVEVRLADVVAAKRVPPPPERRPR
ncbi:ferrous iron transport protein A [Curtobacterium sp. 9128]|uniref:putative acetyltransferase n=1 Tax=Curtobacterium sp. 9128 TaxID=1793722 RepID=UPI0011A291B9|nr:ferrous iron transport protein A [Curtobacterium sp. 9128]